MVNITDCNGESVAKYTYDAWGVCTVTNYQGNIGTINPFRYRGYYYDNETKLYYLQSRYYDPEIGRFINADAPEIVATTQDTLQHNLFAYCENSPVNGCDIGGQAFVQVFAKIILGILLGFFSQLLIDISNHLVELIFNPKAQFSSNPKDYILSMLSSILAFFDIRNPIVRILLGLLQIVLSYVKRSFNNINWSSVVVDLAFLVVSELISFGLNRRQTQQIEKARKTISKNKKKLSYTLRNAKLKKAKNQDKKQFLCIGSWNKFYTCDTSEID